MKFVVSSSSFLMRLQAVSKVISGKPAQPILDNILLVAKDDTLYATASDKETTMEAKIELDNLETPGSITIPAKLLLDILKEFPEQPLTFDINTGTNEVKIISDKGEFSVPGESAEDYPVWTRALTRLPRIAECCWKVLPVRYLPRQMMICVR